MWNHKISIGWKQILTLCTFPWRDVMWMLTAVLVSYSLIRFKLKEGCHIELWKITYFAYFGLYVLSIAVSLWHSQGPVNMCSQIILKVNWLQCSGSDREMCPLSTMKGKLPGHEEPSLARQVGCWLKKRGCVLLKPHLQHPLLQGVLLRDQRPEQLCQPRSERTSFPR